MMILMMRYPIDCNKKCQVIDHSFKNQAHEKKSIIHSYPPVLC